MFQSFLWQYQLYVIFGIFLIGMYAVFFSVPLKKYFQKRQKSTLYFALSNVAWSFTAIINTVYAWDYLNTSIRGPIYYFALPNEFLMTTISAIFIFLFTTGIFKYKRRNVLTAVITGVILVILVFLPFNNWFEDRVAGQFSFQFITMFFTVFYASILYILMAILFIRLTRAKEAPIYMKGIYLGAILFVVFLVFTTIAGIQAGSEIGGYLMVIGWIPMILGSFCFFYGFIKPSLTPK